VRDSGAAGDGLHVLQHQHVLVHRLQQQGTQGQGYPQFIGSDCGLFCTQILGDRLNVTYLTNRYMKPFNSAVNVFCTLTLYLGLLINTNMITRSCSLQAVLTSNFQMVLALLFGLYFGSVYSQPGLKNTAITFLVLYIMQVTTEFYFKYLIANIFVYLFILSVVGFAISF
jgi:hypothetical protein